MTSDDANNGGVSDTPETRKPMSNQRKEIYPDIYNPREEEAQLHRGGSVPVAEETPAMMDGEAGFNPLKTAANQARLRLYRAVRHLLVAQFGADEDALPLYSWTFGGSNAPLPKSPEETERLRLLATYGTLLLRNFDDPSLGRLARGTAGARDITLGDLPGYDYPHAKVLIVPEFVSAVTEAVKKFNTNQELFRQAYYELRSQAFGGRDNGSRRSGDRILESKLLASVTERLITDNVDPNHPFINRKVINALSTTVGGGGFGSGGGSTSVNPSARALEIPDLDGGTAYEILLDNVNAVRFIYFSAQLEEMKLHAVHDKVVEHFTVGMLPITRGAAADKLHVWIKRSADRITEMERRALYGRVLGVAQGGTDVMPNREFSSLWIRFLSTVSQKFREIDSYERSLVSAEQVHKSARDVAVNMSLHGYGWASPAATEMMDIVNEMFSILDEPEVLQAYGVRDRWQLVDRVSNLYLGGASNGVKFRAMAQTGQKLMEWLGSNSAVLASGSATGLRITQKDAMTGRWEPTEDFRSLAEWSERWLAATGTADATVEQYTDPVDLPTQYTVPMLGQSQTNGMPQIVQDALDQVSGSGNLPNLPVIPQA